MSRWWMAVKRQGKGVVVSGLGRDNYRFPNGRKISYDKKLLETLALIDAATPVGGDDPKNSFGGFPGTPFGSRIANVNGVVEYVVRLRGRCRFSRPSNQILVGNYTGALLKKGKKK